jgi:hypothetical protein
MYHFISCDQFLHFLADNIFILLDGRLFQRTIGIPKGRNRPPILADLFLHVYEAFCLEELLNVCKVTFVTINSKILIHVFSVLL